MADLLYTDAFAAYGAKLANPQWAYSAVASDGAIVLSCWAHKLKSASGGLRYADNLSRWRLNTPGKRLLEEHLALGLEENRDIRLIIATTTRPDVVDRGEDASSIPKTFHVREDIVGKVTLFDGDRFELALSRKAR